MLEKEKPKLQSKLIKNMVGGQIKNVDDSVTALIFFSRNYG